MSARIPLPGTTDVTVEASMSRCLWDWRRTEAVYVERPNIWIAYIGAQDEMLRLGLFTADTVKVRSRGGKRRPFYDTRGNRFHRHRWFCWRDGKPIERLKIAYFCLDPGRALELPGRSPEIRCMKFSRSRVFA